MGARESECQISQITPYTLNFQNFTCIITISFGVTTDD